MRIAFALPLLLLGACQADVNDTNDSVTLEYDQNLAENTAETVGAEAREIGGHIANDVGEAAEAVQTEVGEVDADVDVNADVDANAN